MYPLFPPDPPDYDIYHIAEIDTAMSDDYPLRDHIKLINQLERSLACNILPWHYPFRGRFGSPVFCFCCGVGVDSVAGLVELHNRGMRPDLISFADTGGEKPETYEYIPLLQEWLKSIDFPPLLIVRRTPPIAEYRSLYENMMVNDTLPSLAFGMKSCSLRWKKEPQDFW